MPYRWQVTIPEIVDLTDAWALCDPMVEGQHMTGRRDVLATCHHGSSEPPLQFVTGIRAERYERLAAVSPLAR